MALKRTHKLTLSHLSAPRKLVSENLKQEIFRFLCFSKLISCSVCSHDTWLQKHISNGMENIETTVQTLFQSRFCSSRLVPFNSLIQDHPVNPCIRPGWPLCTSQAGCFRFVVLRVSPAVGVKSRDLWRQKHGRPKPVWRSTLSSDHYLYQPWWKHSEKYIRDFFTMFKLKFLF